MVEQTTQKGASYSGRDARSSKPVKVLVLAHGPDPSRFGEIGVLGRVAAVIGRDPAAGLFPGGPVEDGLLSRRHAEVSPGSGGEFRLRDLGSRNGTFVNGSTVRGADEWVLRPGDVIRTGGVLTVYREIPEDLLDLAPDGESSMAGSSAPIRRVQQQLRLLAGIELPVLLQGESGTGKELAAQDLHALGSRRGGTFVPVNCAAIPKELFEATLFGSERGRGGAGPGAARRPTAGPSSWTSSGSCPSRSRRSCCGSSKTGPSCVSGRPAPTRCPFASSLRPARTSRGRCGRAPSVMTSTHGSPRRSWSSRP